jgi:hypothetical protein
MAIPEQPTIPASARPQERWVGRGHSELGAGHIESGQPNQDALRIWQGPGGSGLPCVAAVADGHGAPQSFRSDRGAGFAVAAAEHVLKHVLTNAVKEAQDAGPFDHARLSRVHESIRNYWLLRLHTFWKRLVQADLKRSPITVHERGELLREEGEAAFREVRDNPLYAYGATLLAVGVSAELMVYLQLGDGDIVNVAPDGTATRPVPADPTLAGDATWSLCLPDAPRRTRVVVARNDPAGPAMVMLSTDGYANSYRGDADFLKVASGYASKIRSHGIDSVAAQLPTWLRDTTRDGSGDDITVALLARVVS